ncbi:MAG: stealth family protein [Lachnospiraceae bacterium]|nr:stealth family protein [Lachnospiraceae bacterium]
MNNVASTTSDIDFVIIWVDGSDREWLKQKNHYKGVEEINAGDARYRDWDFLHYWFRAVEKYAPWVRKIHFVTCGQLPAWLNLDNPKLHFVKHSDYIDEKYLPTFSSHCIELNLHRIEGLAEKFVYFNDDMFLNAPVSPEDYFVNNVPCDSAIMNTVKMDRHGIPHVIVNNLCVIADHFDFNTQFKKNKSKWLNLKYGLGKNLRTLFMLPYRAFVGFYELHVPYSFLKSTFTEVWDKEEELLSDVSSHKFRTTTDVNQWLMRYWQLAKGEFVPRSPKIGKLYFAQCDMDAIVDDILNSRHKMICINDDNGIKDFEAAKRRVNEAFEKMLPEKSSFEK